ncbi:site-specific integrase [Nakamurella sp. PAMC28650]|uniref:site-specific integrase n=1 Tax=Nakamurella sp. PAMC28650 TaxID=2762325 RepID=UPI00164E4BF9|nr:site-specific integrase [Nakamurella sp. PAMC28650]QNK79470.1 site-specific integrase [Nakamurella sp. PAMC28650]
MEVAGERRALVASTRPAVLQLLPGPDPELRSADLGRVWAAVDASTSANTKAAYRSDWGRFQRWSDDAGYAALPATGMVVAAYLTDAAAQLRPDGRPQFGAATLSRWASSINQIHTAGGFDPPGRTEVVRRALAGVRRTRKTPPKRRSPLLLSDVRLLLAELSPQFGVWPAAVAAHRDAALLLMGFTGAHRRSELVGLRVQDVTVHRADGLHVRLRSSKTDQEGAGTIRALPYGRDPATCPPCALIRWRRILLAYDAGKRPAALTALHHRGPSTEHVCRDADTTADPAGTDDPSMGERWLFPTVHRAGQPSRKAMTGDAVAAMIKRRAAAAGFTPAQVDLLGGHSLRSGFVTEAFRAGADAHSIMRQTGHKDPKMLEVYAREHAPLVGNAVTKLNL